jgi:hypothetical protein
MGIRTTIVGVQMMAVVTTRKPRATAWGQEIASGWTGTRVRRDHGYYLYALPQDTTKPAELEDYYVPNGTPQDTSERSLAVRWPEVAGRLYMDSG